MPHQTTFQEGQTMVPEGQRKFQEGQTMFLEGQAMLLKGQRMFQEGKTMFPEGQALLLKGQTMFWENMLFSCVLTTHITVKGKQYSPRYFGTNRPKAKPYSLKCFGTNSCQKILFLHGFSSQVSRATNNISWMISALRATGIFHFHVYWVCLLLQRISNSLWKISAPTAAELFYFHVYWLHILLRRQNNILQIFQHQLLPKDFISHRFMHICPRSQTIFPGVFHPQELMLFSHVLSEHIIPNTKRYPPEYFGTNICWNIPFSCVLTACIIVKAKQYSPNNFSTNSCQIFYFYVYWLRI